MSELKDVPIEVTMVDGSRWLIYYRLSAPGSLAQALLYLRTDIERGADRPAADLDGVQRRVAHINMAHIVSFREPEEATSDG